MEKTQRRLPMMKLAASFFAQTTLPAALRLLVVATCALVFLDVTPAQAAVSPLSIGIVPPVQFPPSDYTVTGARLSVLWGHHRDLYGLDLGGLGNITDQDFHGLALSGLFNITKGTTTIVGLQAAGLVNANIQKTHMVGLQFALLANYNEAESMAAGVQLAAANIAKFTDVYGLQIGVYNQARNVYGLQIGLVNVATSLHGIQIGLMNFNTTGLFYVAPILNVGF